MQSATESVRVEAVVGTATPGTWREALLACEALRREDPPGRAHREVLLAYLAPGGPAAGSAEALAALGEDAWSDLVDYVDGPWARMGPLVFSVLRAGGLDRHLPPAALERLRRAHAMTERQNVQRRGDLAALLTRLRENGVTAAVLKGPYMAEHVYADPSARKMADIDLFVPRAALAEVERTLLEMGFGPEAAWRPSIEWSLATSLSLASFEKAGATIVSVHWNLEHPQSPFPIDVDALWERTEPVRLAGQPARILAPEDYLLHLCLHATYRHGFETPMRCYYDLALMTAHFRPRLDWKRLTGRAEEWNCARLAFAAFEIARRLFGMDVPPRVLERLAATSLDRHVGRVAAEYTVRAAPAGSPEGSVARRVLSAWLQQVTGAWPRPEW